MKDELLLIFTLMLLTITLLFSGCSSRPEPVIKVNTITKYINTPSYLVNDNIPLPKPADKETYIKALPLEREMMDTMLIVKLYSTIGKYKLKLKAIRDFDKNVTK